MIFYDISCIRYPPLSLSLYLFYFFLREEIVPRVFSVLASHLSKCTFRPSNSHTGSQRRNQQARVFRANSVIAKSRLWMCPSGLLVPTFPPRAPRSKISPFYRVQRVQLRFFRLGNGARVQCALGSFLAFGSEIFVVISGPARGEK